MARPLKLITLKLKPTIPLEKHNQQNLFQWLNWIRYDDQVVGHHAFAIPNGAMLAGDVRQRAIQMASLKAQGLKPGVPDLMLAIAVAPHHGLFLENKRIGAAKPALEQMEWRDRLIGQGYKHEFCYGLDAAKDAVRRYLCIGKLRDAR